MSKKPYNTTDLDPETTFERHVFHRDQFSHYLRWTFILNQAKIDDRVVDFGCGKGNLLEVLYRNRFKCEKYFGIDIRKQTILTSQKKYEKVRWATFYERDLLDELPWTDFQADKVCSFEVIEHVGKQNAHKFLENFSLCGKDDATFYLSTPNHDPKVGAAGNHTYDSGDGRGVAVQEFEQEELMDLLQERFDIIDMFGTFASVRDYKPLLNDWQKEMFKELNRYYDANLISNIMAPMFPRQSRNTLYVMRKKPIENLDDEI